MGYILMCMSAFILVLGITTLFYVLHHRKGGSLPGPGPSDDDGSGGEMIDLDAPLDLPPGIYVMPPEPEPVAG